MVLVTAVVFVALGVLAGAGARRLLGRLRRGARIPPPGCEVAVAVLWAVAGTAWAGGRLPGEWLPLLLGLAWLGTAASAVDLAGRRLPDALTLPAFPVVLALAGPLGPAAVGRAAVGAGVLFGAHLMVRLVAPAALGAGDVKLSAGLGAALGAVSWAALPVGAALAAGVTGAVAAVGLLTGRVGLGARLPHGPAMCGAGWLVVAGAAGLAG
jgi:leader peptidase (prepilin peptidase)/N-methyltransferase